MYCQACGHKIADGAKFCGACGASVAGVSSQETAQGSRTEGAASTAAYVNVQPAVQASVVGQQPADLDNPSVAYAAYSNHAANVISVGIERQNEYRDARVAASQMRFELTDLRKRLKNCKIAGIVLAALIVLFYFNLGVYSDQNGITSGPLPGAITFTLGGLVLAPFAFLGPFGLSWSISKLRNSFSFWVAIIVVSATILLPICIIYVFFICPLIGFPCRLSMKSRERELAGALETQQAYADSIAPRV